MRWITLPFLAVGVVACASQPSPSHDGEPPLLVNEQLSEAATSVDHSLNELMSLERGPATAQLARNDQSDGLISSSHMTSPQLTTHEVITAPERVSNSRIENSSPQTQVTTPGAANQQYTGSPVYGYGGHSSMGGQTNSTELLSKSVKIGWSGPVDELLIQLSMQLHVKYGETNVKAGRPVPEVHVVAKTETVGALLADIGAQINKSADLVLAPGAQTLTLAYK